MINNKLSRIEKLANVLKEDEAGIISSPVNRRYFLDFASSAGSVFVTKEKSYFIIDFRYFEAAKSKVKDMEVILQEDINTQINQLVRKHNIKNVYLENDYTTLSQMKNYEKSVEPANVSQERKFNDEIIKLRKYKGADEVKRIKEAQRLTDETFSYILEKIKIDKTEKEIALDMEFFMRKQGADAVSFSFIVLTGANTAMPHGVPGNDKVKKGDFVLMDFGAEVDGYRSDMTRTVAVGEISKEQQKVYNIVLESQLKALDKIKPGLSTEDVDSIARDYIYSKGYEGKFGHGLGHSVGIEIHEAPRFAQGDKGAVKEGIVMTVEPGIYLPDEFGVRIEDMGVVTSSGFDNFTKSKKELIIL